MPKTNDWTTLVVSSTYRFSIDSGIQVLYFKIITGTNYPFNVDRFVFIADTGTSINSLRTIQNEFRVYPNPAISKVTVQKTGISNPAKLDVYNVLGIKVRSEIITNKAIELSVEGLSNGIYLFVLTSNNSTETKRILIQK